MRNQLGSSMNDVIHKFIEAGRMGAALNEAARWGDIELVRQLLVDGIPVDLRNETGGTALMNAASGGQLRIVKLLIGAGADVNAVHNATGYTALIWSVAALHPCAKYVKLATTLLNAGAQVEIRAADGRTALEWARNRNCPELQRVLEDHQPQSG
jgi:ankyrin repeat protein